MFSRRHSILWISLLSACAAGKTGALKTDNPDASVSMDGAPDDAGPQERDDAHVSKDSGTPELAALIALFSDPSVSADRLDHEIHELAWSNEGLPVRIGADWFFATRWDDAPRVVALVGDFNDWDTAAHPASRAPTGVHYYVVVSASEFVGEAEGSHYKWWGSPDVYRAPPEATSYDFDENGEHGWVRPPEDESYLQRFPSYSSQRLGPSRALRAFLPAGFVPGKSDGSRVRVILFHDGQNVFHPGAPWGGWRAATALEAGDYEDVIAIGVDSTDDRMAVYTHTSDDIGGGVIGGEATAYAAMIRDEVLPFFRERYGLPDLRDHVAIAGSSLGGLVTLYMALEDPELFRCAIAMSPTLGWGAFGADGSGSLVNRWNTHGEVALYLDSGGGVEGVCADSDGDGVFEDSEQSDNYCTTAQLRDHLVSLGYQFEVDLSHWWEPQAAHNEAAWAARLPRALQFCADAGW